MGLLRIGLGRQGCTDVWLADHVALMFTGVHELTIDDRNRLSVPSSIRASLEAEGHSVRLHLVPGEWKRTLALVPEKHFEAWVTRLRRVPAGDPAAASRSLFLGAASPILETDKHGRILLPAMHLQLAGIERQILLLGFFERWLIMNRDEGLNFMRRFWESHQQELGPVVAEDPTAVGRLWQGFGEHQVELVDGPRS